MTNYKAPIAAAYEGALFMAARDVRERRLEGERMHKRGMVNDMPYNVYSKRARRAQVGANAS